MQNIIKAYIRNTQEIKTNIMNTISKEFHFSASHQLHGLKEGHPCGRFHGHNYIVKIFLSGEPNKDGFVQDYGELNLSQIGLMTI